MSNFYRLILGILILALFVYILLQLVLVSYTVADSGMEPGFRDGQLVLVNKLAYRFNQPDRGQIITFKSPAGDQQTMINRVIGLPGDQVEIKHGIVYVNGMGLLEAYINERPDYILPVVEVPLGRYFVLGDNRNNSDDSSVGWTVAEGSITGQAWLSFWPLEKLGMVKDYNLSAQVDTAEAFR